MPPVILSSLMLFSLAVSAPEVAVLSIDVDGDPPPGVDPLAVVEETVADAAGLRLMAAEDARALVERAARAGLSCELSEVGCAARVGAYARIDFVLVGRVTFGEAASATLTLVDCSRGAPLRVVGSPLGRDAAAVVAGLRELTAETLTGDPAKGTLIVSASETAMVSVDGVARGRAPLELELIRGEHAVAAVNDDGRQVGATSWVMPGATTELALAFDPLVEADEARPPPPSQPPLPWLAVAGLATAGLGVAAGVGLGVAALVVTPALDDRGSMSAKSFNDRVLLGRGLFVGAVVAGGLAAVGGGVAGAGVWLPAE